MKRGDSITIKTICNGVMIEPYPQYEKAEDRRNIVINHAEEFLSWIKNHFEICEVPEENERISS